MYPAKSKRGRENLPPAPFSMRIREPELQLGTSKIIDWNHNQELEMNLILTASFAYLNAKQRN